MLRKTLVIGLTWLTCSCAIAALPLEQFLYEGKAFPFYKDSPNPEQQAILDAVKRAQLAERMASVVNATLRIRQHLGVGFASCGRVNAFFDRGTRAIVFCSEFIEMAGKLAKADPQLMSQPKEQFAQVMNGLVWGVFFHELGHALISINRVPVAGREEDVADQFALWFSLNFVDQARTPVVMPTIWMWTRMASQNHIPSMSDEQRRQFMSDEHSLDEQRIYNIACWAYGTGTEGGRGAAAFVKLPEPRAQRCFSEYAGVDTAMKHSFKKYFKVKPLRGAW